MSKSTDREKVFLTTPCALWYIHTICICTDETLEVFYSHIADNQLDNSKTNIFVAAFTTCLAHLKLYASLEMLGQQGLYFDTDSVIYRWRPGQPDISLGDFLSDMTNELDDGNHITGPKNYSYTTTLCCKVQGFTLYIRGAQQLNYQIMKQCPRRDP